MGKSGNSVRFHFLGLQNHYRGDCSHEIKRHLLLGRKVVTNLGNVLNSTDITFADKVHIVKAVVLPVVVYRCESWTIKKAVLAQPLSHVWFFDPSSAARQASPSFTISWTLLKLMSMELVILFNSAASFSFCLQPVPASGSFPISQFFPSGGQSTGASATTSVFPLNIQGWFLFGWTRLISLMFKGFSRIFSNTTVQKHQF